MAQYHFDMPEGWVGVPLQPPHAGVHIRPEAEQDASRRAVIVLLSPIAPAPTLKETLERMIDEGCSGAAILRRGDVLPFRSVAYPGLLAAVRLRLPQNGAAPPEEGRIFAALDAGTAHLPVVFAGGPESLPLHKRALDRVLSSLRPHVGGRHSPFAGWSS